MRHSLEQAQTRFRQKEVLLMVPTAKHGSRSQREALRRK